MNKDVLLSLIVPCFNVENYVQQCLDSIYSCDLDEKQFEVLCIDDYSSDGTRTILEQNGRQHGNLRIIVNSTNKGLSATRNTGIREAKGEYLWFVDSDDFVTAKGLANLVYRMIDQDLDVLCFNYRQVDEEGKELSEHVVFNETSSQDGYSFVKTVFGKSIVYHMGYVVRFLYRTEYLRSHQLFFPEKVYWEDTVYMPKSIIEASRIASSAEILYSYRVNPKSFCSTFLRTYPAKSIFEFSFCAGSDLFSFSNEVKDEELKDAFYDTAVQKYINGFPIYLFRTSWSERKKFYALIKERKTEVNRLRRNMTMFRKGLLLPVIGPTLAEIGSAVYKVYH